MHVISVNIGLPEELVWEGKPVRTAFRKRPTSGRVSVRGINLDGDDQADRTVHGGPRKTIYVYPSEHYTFWRRTLELPQLGWGAFGENLTTSGWLESEAHVGDRLRLGSAEVRVTQPRTPCYKMNASFGRADMIERFHRSGRSGFYLGLTREGEIGPGDTIELLSRTPGSPTIAELAGTDDG